MKKQLLLFLCISGAVSLLPAQIPDSVLDTYSPSLLGGGAFSTTYLSPQGDMVNPAASALNQRITLDLSYLTLAGNDGSVSGLGGHGVNLGAAIPGKAGVFSFSGHYLGSSYPRFPASNHVSFGASFSKELYEGLSAGAGLNLGFGGDGMAAALDFGVIHELGRVAFFRDFRWAGVVENLGYHSMGGAYPDPFGLRGGVYGSIFDTESLGIAVRTDLAFPGFTNLQWALGGEFRIGDFLTINTASRLDLGQVLDGDYSQFIPSVGIRFSFTTDISEESTFLGLSQRGWNRSEVNIGLAAAPVYENVWAIAGGIHIPLGVVDKTPPEIRIDIDAIRNTLSDESGENDDESSNSESADPEGGEEDGGEQEAGEPISLQSGNGKGTEKGAGKRTAWLKDKPGLGKIRKIPMMVNGEKISDEEKLPEKKSDEDLLAGGEKRFPGEDIIAWLSPNNDGIQDDLTIPITISDSRYVYTYRFVLENEDGEIVRIIENKDERVENEGFRGFFDRLFSVKTGISVPESIRWDGTGNDGTVVEDGLYRFYIEAFDDNGNRGRTETYAIVIDNNPPVISLAPMEADEKIFSPNDDGNKDWIGIDQEGTLEKQWKIVIRGGDGRAVRNETLQWERPDPFVWDGTDDTGVLVPDGVYSYEITSTDRAGNSSSGTLNNIVKNTIPTPVTLTLERSHFSPNGDGNRDRIILEPGVPVETGISSWNLDILNSGNGIVRTYSGEGAAPGAISFDGKDASGRVLPEGSYRGKMVIVYRNGNVPKAESPSFELDLTPPQVEIRISDKLFSPDGDGNKDIITFYQETSLEDEWEGFIVKVDTETGEPALVRSFRWVENAPAQMEWNGTTGEGTLSGDGTYIYYLTSTDRAGNHTRSDERSFRLDTSETNVIITAELETFSPNGDGVKDDITLFPKLDQNSEIGRYTISILDEEDRNVRTFSGSSSMRERYIWDGRDDGNTMAPDGIYRAHLEIEYLKGNREEAWTRRFAIDTVFPDVELGTDYLLFSPDGDGRKDDILIEQRSSSEVLWNGELRDSEGEVVKRLFWKGEVGALRWDGTNEAGNAVEDGIYSYTISSRDEAGNFVEKSLPGITIDTKPTSIFVTADAEAISPTGNGKYEEIGFRTIVNNREGIENWKLDIIGEAGEVEKAFTGEDRIPESIIWNGRGEDGRYREDVYIARFTVSYRKGNLPVAETGTFVLDRSAPELDIAMSPVPFSPDNDGVDDELTISLDVRDRSAIHSWSLQIYDPEAKPFKLYEGTGSPAEIIIWDGVSGSGELVYAAMDYPYRFIVQDAWGNRSVREGKIPVDVLVVREGDLLKIKIASIIFQPNRAEFVEDDPEVKDRNSYVLDRIAEILDKYRNYSITVEGHAALINWQDPEKAAQEETKELQPLSQMRAERVVQALIDRGIHPERLEALGVGGTKPLVPHSETDNRWKNRRVEFILEKRR